MITHCIVVIAPRYFPSPLASSYNPLQVFAPLLPGDYISFASLVARIFFALSPSLTHPLWHITLSDLFQNFLRSSSFQNLILIQVYQPTRTIRISICEVGGPFQQGRR